MFQPYFLAAMRSGSKRCFDDGHDHKVDGSTPTQALLLRPWIKFFMIIIPAWWDPTSSKLKKSEAKLERKTRNQKQFLRQSGSILFYDPVA